MTEFVPTTAGWCNHRLGSRLLELAEWQVRLMVAWDNFSRQDRPSYRPPMGEPDDGMNGHLAMPMTAAGEGPADPNEAHHTACWCGDPGCTLFYGKVCDRRRGIHAPPGFPHRKCLLR